MNNNSLALSILMDFPIHIDPIIMGLPLMYLKRSQVEVLNYVFTVPEGCFNLSKKCRT